MGLLTDEAKDADNHALALQMDVTKAYASREAFDEVLKKMKAATRIKSRARRSSSRPARCWH